MNVLLNEFGIAPQKMHLDEKNIEITISQSKYRNQFTATKRSIELIREILVLRDIKNISLIFQISNVNTNVISFPLEKFINYLDNNSSIPELEKYITLDNFIFRKELIFQAPNFYLLLGSISSIEESEVQRFILVKLDYLFTEQLILQTVLIGWNFFFNIANNLDDFKLKPYSRLPKFDRI